MPTPICEMFTIIVGEVIASFTQPTNRSTGNLGSQKLERTLDCCDRSSLAEIFATDFLDYCVFNIVQTTTEMDDFTITHIDPVMSIKTKIN